jgi:hypothetical protein
MPVGVPSLLIQMTTRFAGSLELVPSAFGEALPLLVDAAIVALFPDAVWVCAASATAEPAPVFAVVTAAPDVPDIGWVWSAVTWTWPLVVWL